MNQFFKPFYLTLLLLFPVFQSAYSASVECGRYQMELRSQAPYFREHMILEKVKKSGGVEGRWKMVRYRQDYTFFGPLPMPISGSERVDMGHGMWMKVFWQAAGKSGFSKYVDGKVLFDVVGNKIGYTGTDVWLGSVSGNQATIKWPTVPNPNAGILRGTIRLKQGREKVELNIQSPGKGDKFVFDSAKPGKLSIDVQVNVSPQQHANKVKWSADKIEGTQIQVQGQGAQAKINYKKLPPENDSFGVHKIKAKLDVDGCEVEESVEVKVFYPLVAKNNPEGKYPNWFYYWKQTPAGKVSGMSFVTEYGGKHFDVCTHPKTTALYKPGYGLKTIHICDLSKLGTKFTNKYPLLNRYTLQKMLGWNKSKWIDTFALAIIHEFQHMVFYHTWRHGKSPAQILQADKDKDGIPGHLEPGMLFDPTKIQTYLANHADLGAIGNDEEWYAFESMRDYQHGTYDKYDWAHPGKQWP